MTRKGWRKNRGGSCDRQRNYDNATSKKKNINNFDKTFSTPAIQLVFPFHRINQIARRVNFIQGTLPKTSQIAGIDYFT